MSNVNVTVRYAGDLVDAHQTDGKIWFAVQGQAVLTREIRHSWRRRGEPVAPVPKVAALIHAVSGWSPDGVEPAFEVHPQAAPSEKHIVLLVKAAQSNPTFAPATALPPGVHIMCHVEYPSDIGVAAQSATYADGEVTAQTSMIGEWRKLWQELKAGAGAAEEDERLAWQRPCLELLTEVASALGSKAIASIVDSVPLKGWALVPCSPVSNLVCSLAHAGETGDGGKVGWFHVTEDAGTKAAVALADSLLLLSDANVEPAYASVLARKDRGGEVDVTAETHGVVSGGVLSGYDLSSPHPNAGLQAEIFSDERTDNARAVMHDAFFVDDSTMSAEVDQTWRGTVSTEELPGGGLHRHVRVKINASCAGHSYHGDSYDRDAQDQSDHEWCEVLLAQHVPQGAYIDVDEVKARHDFDVISSLPTRRKVGVETFGSEPIDVELPSSVSGQHLVNFNLRVGIPSGGDGRERGGSIRAEMTLPVHLRYPDPGCERIGEECEKYAWVEVPPPLASIRCGTAGARGAFVPVLPSMPPIGVALRVPRGIAWQRDMVAWGTMLAAAAGTLYTVYTLWTKVSIDTAQVADRKKQTKNHAD